MAGFFAPPNLIKKAKKAKIATKFPRFRNILGFRMKKKKKNRKIISYVCESAFSYVKQRQERLREIKPNRKNKQIVQRKSINAERGKEKLQPNTTIERWSSEAFQLLYEERVSFRFFEHNHKWESMLLETFISAINLIE